jgi:hypothetical protein
MIIDIFSYKIYKTTLEFPYRKQLIDIVNQVESDTFIQTKNKNTTDAKIFDIFENDSRFKTNNVNLTDCLVLEIEKNLSLFSKQINLNKKLIISNLWCVSYKKNQKCVPHHHKNEKNYVFSGIYYLSFDKNEHQATTFYNNESLEKSFTPLCDENDLIIYPAGAFHGYSGTESKKTRIVFPFDICYDKKLINYH